MVSRFDKVHLIAQLVAMAERVKLKGAGELARKVVRIIFGY